MSLTPYPKDFPSDALRIAFDGFRGQQVPRNELIHSCYELLGYGLGKTFPHDSSTPPDVNVYVGNIVQSNFLEFPPPTEDEILEASKEAERQDEQSRVGVVQGISAVIPWGPIIRMALLLLLRSGVVEQPE